MVAPQIFGTCVKELVCVLSTSLREYRFLEVSLVTRVNMLWFWKRRAKPDKEHPLFWILKDISNINYIRLSLFRAGMSLISLLSNSKNFNFFYGYINYIVSFWYLLTSSFWLISVVHANHTTECLFTVLIISFLVKAHTYIYPYNKIQVLFYSQIPLCKVGKIPFLRHFFIIDMRLVQLSFHLSFLHIYSP